MSTDTITSPGIGALPSEFSVYGGIIVDMVGTNGTRVTGQVSPAGLMDGYDAIGTGVPWQHLCAFPGFSAGLSQLGGGIAKCNIRITLSNGDTGAPNPIYETVFGANSMPFSGPYAMLPGDLPMVPGRNAFTQPPGWDFNAGTDIYLGLDVGTGSYINCGYMSDLTTYRLDGSGDTDRTFTGFPGTWALGSWCTESLVADPRYPAVMAAIAALPAADNCQFPVTGWFSVPSGQLAGLYTALLSNDVLNVGMLEADPGYAFFDFSQGTGSNIPVFAPGVLSFTATPNHISSLTEVTLAWSTTNATSVSINQSVGSGLALSGSQTVLVSATTTFTLTATGVGGSVTATVTVTSARGAVSISSFTGSPATAPYTGHALLQWVALNADSLTLDGVTVTGNSAISTGTDTTGVHAYTLIATQGTGGGATTATATTTMSLVGLPLSIATASPLPVVASTALTITPITFQGLGGYGAYSWTATGLPSGLSMSSGGVLSGTLPGGPSTTYNFTVTVTDSASTPATHTKAFILPFGLCPLQIITTQSDLDDVLARDGQPYSFQFVALYGIGAQTWSLASGALPPGVSLSSTGLLTGTPVNGGNGGYWDFTIQVAAGLETNTAFYELMVRMAWSLTAPFQNIFYRVLDQNGDVVIGPNGQPMTNDLYPDSADNEYFGQMVVAFTLGPNDFTVTDVRQRGGGLDAADQNIPAAAGFWDLGYWDGKPYPLGGGLAVYLPQAILSGLTRDQIAAKLTAILPLGTLPVVRYYAPDGEESL